MTKCNKPGKLVGCVIFKNHIHALMNLKRIHWQISQNLKTCSWIHCKYFWIKIHITTDSESWIKAKSPQYMMDALRNLPLPLWNTFANFPCFTQPGFFFQTTTVSHYHVRQNIYFCNFYDLYLSVAPCWVAISKDLTHVFRIEGPNVQKNHQKS